MRSGSLNISLVPHSAAELLINLGTGARKANHQARVNSSVARPAPSRAITSTFRYVRNTTQGSRLRCACGPAPARPRLPVPLPRTGSRGHPQSGDGVAIWLSSLLFANELRTRAREISDRAASTDDLEAQETMHAIAAGYHNLARRVDERAREVVAPQRLAS
jgi:hypothetical protein